MTNQTEEINQIKEKIAWELPLTEEEQAICIHSKECQALILQLDYLNAQLSTHFSVNVPEGFCNAVMNKIYGEAVYKPSSDDRILDFLSRLLGYQWIEAPVLIGGLIFAIPNLFRTFFAVFIPLGI